MNKIKVKGNSPDGCLYVNVYVSKTSFEYFFSFFSFGNKSSITINQLVIFLVKLLTICRYTKKKKMGRATCICCFIIHLRCHITNYLYDTVYQTNKEKKERTKEKKLV